MGRYVKIAGNDVVVTVDSFGAQIKSVVKGEREYMWQGSEDSWDETAPVLFPICGRLHNGVYTYKGQKYEMMLHGFAKSSEFTVEDIDEDRVTFLLCDSEKTRKIYPFSFEFRVSYRVVSGGVSVTYGVKNTGDDEMYFSFGGHEGFLCPEGAEEYTVTFPEDSVLERVIATGGYSNGEVEQTVLDDHKLHVSYAEVQRSTYVFRNVRSKWVELSGGDRRVRVDFGDTPIIAVWTLPGEKFVCIEPWHGLVGKLGEDVELSTKEQMIRLGAGQKFESTHIISVS